MRHNIICLCAAKDMIAGIFTYNRRSKWYHGISNQPVDGKIGMPLRSIRYFYSVSNLIKRLALWVAAGIPVGSGFRVNSEDQTICIGRDIIQYGKLKFAYYSF